MDAVVNTDFERRRIVAFGLVVGGAIIVFFGLLLPWLKGRHFPTWPWGAGTALAAWACIAPRSLGPVYRVWMKFGAALGWVNTRIILGIVFYAIVTPIGVTMRFLRRDPLGRTFQPGMTTYRVPSSRTPRARMEVPF